MQNDIALFKTEKNTENKYTMQHEEFKLEHIQTPLYV